MLRALPEYDQKDAASTLPVSIPLDDTYQAEPTRCFANRAQSLDDMSVSIYRNVTKVGVMDSMDHSDPMYTESRCRLIAAWHQTSKISCNLGASMLRSVYPFSITLHVLPSCKSLAWCMIVPMCRNRCTT